VRSLDSIYQFGEAAGGKAAQGASPAPAALAEKLGIDAKPLLECWTCHR
jgi:hypothetical protein